MSILSRIGRERGSQGKELGPLSLHLSVKEHGDKALLITTNGQLDDWLPIAVTGISVKRITEGSQTGKWKAVGDLFKSTVSIVDISRTVRIVNIDNPEVLKALLNQDGCYAIVTGRINDSFGERKLEKIADLAVKHGKDGN